MRELVSMRPAAVLKAGVGDAVRGYYLTYSSLCDVRRFEVPTSSYQFLGSTDLDGQRARPDLAFAFSDLSALLCIPTAVKVPSTWIFMLRLYLIGGRANYALR